MFLLTFSSSSLMNPYCKFMASSARKPFKSIIAAFSDLKLAWEVPCRMTVASHPGRMLMHGLRMKQMSSGNHSQLVGWKIQGSATPGRSFRHTSHPPQQPLAEASAPVLPSDSKFSWSPQFNSWGYFSTECFHWPPSSISSGLPTVLRPTAWLPPIAETIPCWSPNLALRPVPSQFCSVTDTVLHGARIILLIPSWGHRCPNICGRFSATWSGWCATLRKSMLKPSSQWVWLKMKNGYWNTNQVIELTIKGALISRHQPMTLAP